MKNPLTPYNDQERNNMKDFVEKQIRRMFTATVAVMVFGLVNSAFAATQIYWVGGSGGSEAAPLEVYDRQNFNTEADGSGKVPESNPRYVHSLNFTVDSLTYLTNSNPNAATAAICEAWKFNGGDCVVLGDMCFDGLYMRGTSSVTKKGDWMLAGCMNLGDAENIVTAFTNKTGVLEVSGPIYVGTKDGAKASLAIQGGELRNTARNTSIGDVAGSAGKVTVGTGAKLTCLSSYYTWNVKVGGMGMGTLDVEGGEVRCDGGDGRLGFCVSNGSESDASMSITDGGLVTVRQIAYGNGNGAAAFTINGGTVKALADGILIDANNKLTVKVGTNGGTIDAAGKAVVIAEPFLEDSDSAGGGMTFRGGGSVTLANGNTYTGKTTVEVGTVLFLPSAIAGDRLAVTVPDGIASGVYPVLSISAESADVFAEGSETAIACDDLNARFAVSSDKRTIYCLYDIDSSAHVYLGPVDGNLSDAANWLSGSVPTDGNAHISCASAATLAVGDAFRPDTLTIPDSSAVITINEGDLHLVALTNACRLAVASGAELTVSGDLVGYAANNTNSILYSNEGAVTVGGSVHFRSRGGNGPNSIVCQYAVTGENTTPIVANRLEYTADSFDDYLVANLGSMDGGPGKWVIGSGGLTNHYSRNIVYSGFRVIGQDVTLHSVADWTLDESYRHKGRDLAIMDSDSKVTIDTTDWNDRTTPRTVTFKGFVYEYTSGGELAVIGCGKVVLANEYAAISNTVEGVISVAGDATFQVNCGSIITGSGFISLAEGATLAFPSNDDRTMTMREILPVTLPAEGKAAIRIDGRRLYSGDHVILNSVPEGYAEHLTVTGNAIAERKTSLKAEDGKLILSITPKGLTVILK